MGLSRSTYYDVPSLPTDDAALVATMIAICDEFEAYGYRRVGAELRHRGIVVNSKKIRRLMRENDLQPKRRKRFVATTDSDHDGPIFPDLARHRILDGPNQVWVADITYIAIAAGFVYMAAILDAWSRRVVGYAISRSIDARLAVAALKTAIRARQPPKGCVHHLGRPLTDHPLRTAEAIQFEPPAEFGAVPAASSPLCIEQRQVCIERALPRPEDVTSIAPKDLADTIATVAGFTNDLLDGRAILGERQDGGNGLLTSQVTLVLQSFRAGQ